MEAEPQPNGYDFDITLGNLPEDIFLYVFEFLIPKDLLIAARVSVGWKDLADSDCVWRSIAFQNWGWLKENEVDIEIEKEERQCSTWKLFWKSFALDYLKQVSWYNAAATRTRAEDVDLSGKPRGTFLVRSSSEPGHLVVSYVASPGEVLHTLVFNLGAYKGVFFVGETRLHATVASLIRYNRGVFNRAAYKCQSHDITVATKRGEILTLLNSPYERDGIPLDQLGLLHQCCRYGLADIAAKIIKAGSCTVNYRRSKNGQTPLHYLARYCSTLTQDEQSEMFFVLSSARIDLNVLDFSGCAPLHYLLDQTYTGPLVQLFIGAGSDLFIPRASDGLRPIHLMANHNHHVSLQANMTRLKPEINARQDRPPHRTALHIASLRSRKQFTELLIKNGANVNDTDAFGSTPLHLAVSGPQDWTNLARVGRPLNQSTYSNWIVSFLINHGADVNATDIDGRTALHEACINGHRTSAHVLMNSGADINLKDHFGKSPLDYCLEGATSWQVRHHIWLLEEKIAAGFSWDWLSPEAIRLTAERHYNDVVSAMKRL